MSLEVKKQNEIAPKAAAEILWRKGDLSFLLDKNQLELKNKFNITKQKISVWALARGVGKSYLLVVIAIEACLKNSKALVKYACPTQSMAVDIVQPLFRDILETCPDELKPEYKTNLHAYVFPSGAKIQLSGLDAGRAERLRGGSANLAIIDEGGMVKGSSSSKGNLKYIIRSIMIPSITRNKRYNGKLILASTPPENISHPFVEYVKKADYDKTLTIKTIYDCPRYTQEMINDLIDNTGGRNSVDFRREFMVEFITDSSTAVIPEFTKELQDEIIKEWDKPQFFHPYVSMDIGVRDLTVVIFAYYDFRAAKVIIEDELVMGGRDFNTQKLAVAIKKKEQELWTNKQTDEQLDPFKRVSDNNLIVIRDMYDLHGLIFEPTRKDDADAALNNLKIMLAANKIIINPKCEVTIRHLRDGTWDKNKKTFSRSVDNGHYDAIDACKYLIRNIEFNLNPYPPGFGVPFGDGVWNAKRPEKERNAFAIRQMLNIKKL